MNSVARISIREMRIGWSKLALWLAGLSLVVLDWLALAWR